MNLTLVGMPASGKSTVGVLLAKRLGLQFLDGDLLIQEKEGKLLSEIIEEKGLEGFLDTENAVNRDVPLEHALLAPGGSIVYCKEAMERLKRDSIIIYLKLSYEALEERLGSLKDRGVAIRDGMTLRDLYNERCPLYEKYADITVDEAGKEVGEIVDELRAVLSPHRKKSVAEAKSAIL